MKAETLPAGLSTRPAKPIDHPFLETLHHSTRADLQLIDAEQDVIESLVDMQFKAQTMGYASQFPNAMYWVIEKHGQRIGKATLDFSHDVVHLVDLAFIPEARGKGYGSIIVRSYQDTARQLRVPMSLMVLQNNWDAKRVYSNMGFRVDTVVPPYESLIWYPPVESVSVGASYRHAR